MRMCRVAGLMVVLMSLVWQTAAYAETPPLILSNLSTTEEIEEQLDVWGVARTPLVYSAAFDPLGTGTFERPDLMEIWLDNHLEDNYEGFLVLDWEEGVMTHLAAGPSDPEFARVVSEMVELLEFVRERRPDAKIGYYRMPWNEYWSQDDAWRAAVAAASPVLDASDALFPSVYDHYGDRPDRDDERLGVLVRLALEIAGERPVILYTMHRYHSGNKTLGSRLINADEYVEHIAHLMQVEYGGRHPAGVVAWAEEPYWYRASNSKKRSGRYVRTDPTWVRWREVFASEMAPGESLDDYLNRLHPWILCLLNEAVRGEPCHMKEP